KGGNDPTPLNKGGNDPTPLNKGGNDPTPLNKGGNDPTPLNKGSNHSTPLNKGSNEILVPPLIRGARGDQASGRVAVVDVAHEALIRQWPLLRKWIDENRDILRQKRKIEAAAEEWRERGKSKGYLLQGKQLTDATTFQKKQAGKLTVSVLAQEFIQKSLRYRRNNRLKFVGLGLIVPLGLAVYLGVVAAREIRIRELRATLEAVKGQRNNTQIILVLEDLVKLNASLANIDLSGANLSGANFSGANLNRANLSRANLSRANLSRADLSGADLNDADLSGADLSGADLRSADLRGANFRGVGLRGANLGGAILHDTSLSEANLRGADLSGANFRGADLSYADLGGVNLYGADLGGADLGGADFRGAKNLTPEQVKSAKNWQQATYDDNFRKKLGLKK
ncbi:pentapeptide repeat-containing protein, partial [Microseira sp. BLCC-F43]|uniref:pentapeptide repeat-containing protein n=1 Tax=Microseira sp. BLCC-F43 TaxID=3153602 RepID=UPI0035B74303